MSLSCRCSQVSEYNSRPYPFQACCSLVEHSCLHGNSHPPLPCLRRHRRRAPLRLQRRLSHRWPSPHLCLSSPGHNMGELHERRPQHHLPLGPANPLPNLHLRDGTAPRFPQVPRCLGRNLCLPIHCSPSDWIQIPGPILHRPCIWFPWSCGL